MTCAHVERREEWKVSNATEQENNMGGYAEDDEDKASAEHPDGDAIAARWNDMSATITAIGHTVAGLQTNGQGGFDQRLRTSLFTIAQSCTDVGIRLSLAADQATAQAVSDKFHTAFLKQDTLNLQSAKRQAAVYAQSAKVAPNNASIAQQSADAAARVEEMRGIRTSHLGEWHGQATGNTQSLPGHGQEVAAAAERANAAQQQLGGSVVAPAQQSNTGTWQQPIVNSGAPSSRTPSKPEQSAKTTGPSKTEDNKSSEPKIESAVSNGQQPQGQPQSPSAQQGGQQQGAGQGGQPQAGAGQPPSSQTPRSTTPVVTPINSGGGSNGRGGGGGGGGAVRPAATLPPRTPSPSGPLGTGTGAKPSSPVTALGTGNGTGKGGGGAAGAATAANAGSGNRSATTSGGMMGGGAGAGHGGQQNGTTRQRVEIKDRGQRGDLQGRAAEDAATGGVAVEELGPPTSLPDRDPRTMPQVPQPPTPPTPPTRG